MNWKEITQRWPKAFDKLELWGNHPSVLSRQKKRLLYDFFDENEIIIELGVDYTLEPKYCFKVNRYYPKIIQWMETDWSYLYYTRTEAEVAAFTKAFEILNDKL